MGPPSLHPVVLTHSENRNKITMTRRNRPTTLPCITYNMYSSERWIFTYQANWNYTEKISMVPALRMAKKAWVFVFLFVFVFFRLSYVFLSCSFHPFTFCLIDPLIYTSKLSILARNLSSILQQHSLSYHPSTRSSVQLTSFTNPLIHPLTQT